MTIWRVFWHYFTIVIISPTAKTYRNPAPKTGFFIA
ncbi:hypothetical protein YSA_09093 [Pseudomonas putida ND6]|uniref:Uncharacterized protein n=1 Tax=Pseudomonas putida ND6 TaxID=231023 RepID=I3V1R6_PSEPU|nr:hypothetical protein YSA_09093 [Pseudomonas putida ND6]